MKSVFAIFLLVAMTSSILRAQPEKGYDVHYYNATIQLDRAQDSLWGQVTMTATAEDSIVGILQHEKYLVIDTVFVNNIPASVQYGDTTSGEYFVIPQTPVVSGSQFQVLTYYHGKPLPEQYVRPGWGGVTDDETLGDSMMFAMGVGFYAPYTGCTRHWLPCYDLPDDKADSVDLTFITPPGDLTASNGTLVSNSLTPNGIHKGERIMHWHEGYPIATYLLTFATGPFTVQEIPNALGLPFEVYTLASDSAKAAAEMNGRVSQILAFYASLFAPYPFEKVGYVVTAIGSMEHQTMISLDSGVLFGNPATDTTDVSTIAVHELSHMWWGDRVTCKTFDDAWLNEGFAHFCESLDLEHLFGREKYISRQHENIVGAKSSNLPLFAAPTVDHHSSNYPYSTLYQKGAAVLGMLRQYLGDSVFFKAVRYYGNTHAYSTATSYDLWNDFDTISGRDLGWFFQPWVFGTGYPKDTIVWSKTATGANITFHQIHNNDSAPYFRLSVPIKGSTKSGQVAMDTIWMDSTQTSSATANFGFQPDTVIFDPDGLLLWRIVKLTKVTAGVAPVEAELEGLTLAVFPNPDNDHILEIELGCSHPLGEVELSICDESGKILKSEHFTSGDTHADHTLALNGLANGSYLVIARSGNESVSKTVSIAQ
ncbi:MAG: M1 family aminopeptidase [Candidatus Kapaibacterium sp.]